MPVLKLPAPALAELAAKRGYRKDIGSTAVWHYPAENSKGKLLFVHGFRGDHHGLSASAGALVDYDVYIPDLPGYGKTEELESHDLESYGNWLRGLVSELGPDLVVVGHSFGSLVVSKAVSRGLVARAIVLQNPITTRSSEQKDLANRVARGFYALAIALGRLGSAFLRSWVVVRVMSVAMATSKSPKLRSWIHGQHHRHFSTYRSDRVAHEGFATASGSSVMDFAASFKLPTLLIAGEKDLIAPLANQLKLQGMIPGSKLEVMAGVGHLTHYESAAQVAVAIDEFLGEL
jgi:pimeloyl-ACP methyl ester carboxylesterase